MNKLLLITLVFLIAMPIAYSIPNPVVVYDFAQTSGSLLNAVDNSDNVSLAEVITSRTETGINGNAWDFNQISNDKITLSASLMDDMTEGSLMCWAKPDTIIHGMGLFGAGASNDFWFRAEAPPTEYIVYRIKTTTLTYSNVNVKGVMANDRWQMWGWSYNGTAFCSYMNDTQVQCRAAAGTLDMVSPVYIGDIGSNNEEWNGLIDECYVWNDGLTPQDFIDLWNGGTGEFYPFEAVGVPATPTFSPPTLNDGNFTNDANPIINISHSGIDIKYYLYFGNVSTLDETHLVLNNVDETGTGYRTYTDTLSSNIYYYMAKVRNTTNNKFSLNTSIRNFTVDLESPALVTDFTNDSLIFNKNLTGQFNFSDNIQLHSINVSVDGSTIFNITNINTQNYTLNLSYNISALSIGKHDLTVYWADGHTATELKGDYDMANGLFNDYLKYEFPDKGNIKTELKSKSIFDDWSSEKRKDRYIQILKPATPSDTITLIEESDMPIYTAYKEGSYNDYWIIMGNHWKDYVLENEDNIEVSIKRINEKKVEVTISGIKNQDRLVFSSVGDLNTVTKEYSFYAINMTETFDTVITEGFEFSLLLDVDFGNIEFDISGITPVAILQWNSTNFTSILTSYDSTGASFRKTFSPIGITTIETITHNWWFNFSTFTDGYLRTSNASQIASSIDVGICNETVINHTILNFTYFDEVNDESISITNAYQLTLFDGTFYYNQTGSFVDNVTSSFCTNLNPLEVAYNWDMWGLMTLSKTDYITRVLDIDEGVPIALSNDPQTNLSLFLVGTLNSSTVTYTWQTTGFQPIDGTMRIFRCNDDGTQDLIESTPIISGEATANIQLLLQTYSYDVIIGGVVFKDLESYSRCHVESTTERTFFVDVDPIDIAPLIGLAGIICSLEESAINNSVTMAWTTNPELSGYVTGCIVADRRTIRGSVNVLDNCSIESEGYTRTLAIPVVDGNSYIVKGRLEQGNNVINCIDKVILTPGRAVGGLFGVSGLLAVIFLVCSLALIYASDGEFMLAGGAIGLIIAWFLGILVFDWLVVSGIIFFFALIAITGRYTRKK